MQAMEYLAAKAAAGIVLFILFIIVAAGWDLYAWSELLHEWMWSSLIVGYAPVYSMVTDAVAKLTRPKYRLSVQLLLYTLGGFLPFVIWFRVQFFIVLYAGLIGTVCAYVYLVLYLVLKKRGLYTLVAAAVALSILLVLFFHDFTVKRGWSELRGDTSYEASFSLLHGQISVPIEVEAGQLIEFSVNWQTSGGNGYSLKAPDGKYAGMEPVGDFDSSTRRFTAEESGVYRIVLTGDRLTGRLKVEWSIWPAEDSSAS
jgi:hypothetical protein